MHVCLSEKLRGEKHFARVSCEQEMADSGFPTAKPARKEEGGGDGADKRREPAMPEHDGKSPIHQI